MRNISVITDREQDDIIIRKQLEQIAFDLHGDLCGFKLNEEKKAVYIFRFINDKKIVNFKKNKLLKNYKVIEEKNGSASNK